LKITTTNFRIFFSILSIIVVLGSLFASPAPARAAGYYKVIHTITIPGLVGTVRGLAYGSDALWVADDNFIYRVDQTGSVVATYDPLLDSITDLGWFENSLWAHAYSTGLHKLDGNMTVIESHSFGAGMNRAFEWVNGTLYLTENNWTIQTFSREFGPITNFLFPVLSVPRGMAYDGSALWSGDLNGWLYRYTTGGVELASAEISSLDSSCTAAAWKHLAYGANSLWYACNTSIYQLDVQDDFVDVEAGLADAAYSEAVWGDYDSDGDLDIALIGHDASSADPFTRIYRSNGSFSFTEVSAGLSGVYSGSVDWGDYENDGDLDLLITGCSSLNCTTRLTRIYRNNGGAFSDAAVSGLPNVGRSDAEWGDYDNDGDLDVLLLGHTGASGGEPGVTGIYQNAGGGAFNPVGFLDENGSPLTLNLYEGAAAWADYDNDNQLDALVTGCTTSTCAETSLAIFKNLGNNTFQRGFLATGARYSSVAWGDYDNDGDPDVLLAGSAGQSGTAQCRTTLYRNDNGAAFTEINTGIGGVCNASVAWGDYDNDGRLDIAIVGAQIPGGNAMPAKVYRNAGAGVFTDIRSSLGVRKDGSLAWGDANNDGRLDLLLTGLMDTRVYRNVDDISLPNGSPSAPDGLSAEVVSASSARLSWDAAADVETPPGGLSYNVRVGTTSGASDVVSPASAGSGYRRVPQTGNAGADRSFLLAGLKAGQAYTWSVQAVDQAFAGSTFAAQGSFTMPAAQVAFASPEAHAGEAAGSAKLAVTLNAPSIHTVTVQYATSDGTAAAGLDYTAASGTLTFAPGQTSQEISVPILEDAVDEAAESIVVTLSGPVNASLGANAAASLWITDDDLPTVRFSATTYSIHEYTPIATITVTLSGPPDPSETVTVDYRTADGTAAAPGDYTAASGTLVFGPGETSKTFTVPIVNDSEPEPTQDIVMELIDPANASLGVPSTAWLNILDDDVYSPPSIRFQSSSYSVMESSGSAAITLTLDTPSSRTISVYVMSNGGSATPGADYTAVGQTIIFESGETTQTFSVPITDDMLVESSETVTLKISSPINASIGEPSQSVLTIVDNDGGSTLPSIRFQSSTYSVEEGAGFATITLALDKTSSQEISVYVASSDGTATAGADYTAVGETVTFAPGQTTQTLRVLITKDLLKEGDETLTLGLRSPSNAGIGAPSQATLTILANDAVFFTFLPTLSK